MNATQSVSQSQQTQDRVRSGYGVNLGSKVIIAGEF